MCIHRSDLPLLAVAKDGKLLCVEVKECAECKKWGSTVCASCGSLISPGTPYAVVSKGKKGEFSYTHAEGNCCNDPTLYRGMWGLRRGIAVYVGPTVPVYDELPEYEEYDTSG